jgi:hypothetical protein
MSCLFPCLFTRNRRLSSHSSASHSDSFASDDDLEDKLEVIKEKHRKATLQLPKMKGWSRSKSKAQEFEELPVYTLTDGQFVCSGRSERVYFC